MVGAVKEHMDYDLTTLDMLCCDWVKAMDVQMYMRVSDKIDATLGDKELSMPEKTIMNDDCATLKKQAEATKLSDSRRGLNL